ncbi:MAG: CDP-diacylglycerol--serine O-phosphatidyltransferase [Pseudomonadota bacterium]
MEVEEDQPELVRKPRPGIYLLPNLFTTGAMFAGFYAIVAAMNGRFVAAAEAVFIAGLLDGLDGRVARLTNTQSDFGVQYDSLSDLISFGLAPALVMYLWSLSSLAETSEVMGKIGWLAAFLFAACAALRLARFNTQAESSDKRYFQGLASPAAAAGMITPVWVLAAEGVAGAEYNLVMLPITVALALLMVSNVRYVSFKGWPNRDKVPFLWILALLGFFVLLAIDPPLVLLCIAYTYAFSGPCMTVLGRKHRLSLRRRRRGDGEAP